VVESEAEGVRIEKPAATSLWLVAFPPLGAVIVYGSSRHLYVLCDWALWLLGPVLAMLALAARAELRALPAEGHISRRKALKRDLVIEVAMALAALTLALVRPGFISTPSEVAACLRDYAKPELQPADLQRVREEGLPTCFDGGHRLRGRQAAHLPIELGHDAANQLPVVAFAYDQGCNGPDVRVGIRYRGVEQSVCCQLNARPIGAEGMGRWYVGCEPAGTQPNAGPPRGCSTRN
jgi:hypothetical protein